MAYDVASSIGELLFENNSVIVPNFGGFMLSYRSATADHVQAVLSPPSKVATFNPNLVVNDGVLVNHIKNQNHLTLEQAKKVVADYVEEVKDLISKKEMLDLPKVGRLYKDYSNEMKFLPLDTNFNTSSFGLPEVKYQPITRSQQKKETLVTTNTTAENQTVTEVPNAVAEVVDPGMNNLGKDKTINAIPINDKEKSKFSWARTIMPGLIAASLFLVMLSFYFLRKDNHPQGMESATAATVSDSDRVNQKPTLESTEIPNDENDVDENFQDEFIGDEDDTTTNFDDLAENECVVIIAQFGDKKNALKYAEKIELDGYDTYTGWNSKKEWSMIGVRFQYDTKSEKLEMLRKLQRKYDSSAWILAD